LKKIHTRIFKISPGAPSREAIHAAAGVVRTGGVFVFPTDTVYGLGCHLFRRDAVGRVYALKGRHYSKPLPVLIHDLKELSILAESVPKEALPLMKKFWPGPLTLVFKASTLARIATGGRDTIAVRLPKDKFLRGVLRAAGLPLASTSANASGKPACTSGKPVIAQFSGRVEVIVDAGTTEHEVASTVLDLSSYPFTVRREGAVSKHTILQALHQGGRSRERA
jgi:L-threonylcarbamoyladenylate synthase